MGGGLDNEGIDERRLAGEATHERLLSARGKADRPLFFLRLLAARLMVGRAGVDDISKDKADGR